MATYLEGCIPEFGLTPLICTPVVPPRTRSVGYRAPEVMKTRKPTQKLDIYSFEVLLLEGLSRCRTPLWCVQAIFLC
ncbi:hypothetical protein EUGRSUZ_H04907 [Eucalyptus grandis]|uniref:Uncharacterized protein n=2 Tax=Eucalyptus grandis TaxID=71139 RepID=A0ACC3JY30_EUCGR|nr:hypothetical protein EUGRSUZ_H04907 [Eucalyptus grandis]